MTKLAFKLAGLAAFAAVAGCSSQPSEDQQKAKTDPAVTEAKAYAAKNGCKVDFELIASMRTGDVDEGFPTFSACNTDPQHRGTTKAQEAKYDAEKAAMSAWEKDAIADDVSIDLDTKTTAEETAGGMTRITDFDTGRLCTAFADKEKGECRDFESLTGTQKNYVAKMQTRFTAEQTYQARKPAEPKDPRPYGGDL